VLREAVVAVVVVWMEFTVVVAISVVANVTTIAVAGVAGVADIVDIVDGALAVDDVTVIDDTAVDAVVWKMNVVIREMMEY